MNRFGVETVIVIGLQLLTRLKCLHEHNYIYRDLKPANILISAADSFPHLLYLVDFGLTKKEDCDNPNRKVSSQAAEKFINDNPGEKSVKTAQESLAEFVKHEKTNFKVVGTAFYAALAAHLPSKKYLKKDDIESLLFLLSYFGLGQLPWKYKSTQEGLHKLMKAKLRVTAQELFPTKVFPTAFQCMFHYIRSIPDDVPLDYGYLYGQFKAAASKTALGTQIVVRRLDWMEESLSSGSEEFE